MLMRMGGACSWEMTVYDITTSGTETSPVGGFWRIRIKGSQDQTVADFTIS